MKRNRVRAVLAMAFSLAAAILAQEAPGAFLQAELQTAVKAKKAKVGDPVKARIASAMPLPDGTLLSSGTTLLGEVRAVQPNSISISFDQIEAEGKKRPLALSVRAAMLPGGPKGEPAPVKAVSAQSGSVIGMPGVSLEIDEGPQHASKFTSEAKDFQLKQGTQLMLAVVK